MARFNRIDLEHILRQIMMAEAGQPPLNPHLAFGLRQVNGQNNNSVPGNNEFGAADRLFPHLGAQVLQTADLVTVDLDGPGGQSVGDATSYTQTSGFVFDSDPRTISNLISDQTANNPAALAAQAGSTPGTGYLSQIPNPAFNPGLPVDPVTNPQFLQNNVATPPDLDASGNLFIPNVTPDAGLSAPFNSWLTFFGQFFDHGLDLVSKGGNGYVFIPLNPDDPLYNADLDGADNILGTSDDATNFMVLTRATQFDGPGPNGILGDADDTHHETQNTTTPFVDQNQTYSSHPSHQVFLREYAVGPDGVVRATGNLLCGADGHSMATWTAVKANALLLGIVLNDTLDVMDIPLVKVDAFGNFIPDPITGLAQLVTGLGADGQYGTADDVVISAVDAAHPITTAGALRIGHAFLNDIAHSANPVNQQTGAFLLGDADGVIGVTTLVNPLFGASANAFDLPTVQNVVLNPNFDPGLAVSATNPQYLRPSAVFDNELLNAHYIAGDGRVNENIGLIAVHEIFHSEHNRQIELIKAMVRTELANGDSAFATDWVLAGADLSDGIQDNEWNGERLFQAAKFATEVQYQHIVFEEFARKIAPTIHFFGNNDIALDPAITAEFAHAVYRFGHSMLDETVNRYVLQEAFLDANGVPTAVDTGVVNPLAGTPMLDANGDPVLNDIGLIEAFLNPLEFAAHGSNAAAEIILGSVNQVGNEIDEFVTGALRNNLVGLPLDLAALNIARGRDTGVPPLNLLRNQLFAATHDTVLKPYANWNEFGQFLKHAESLVNFIAAYGTHSSITSATTMVDKRAAAQALLDNSVVGSASFSQDAFDFVYSAGGYANNLADPRAMDATWSTGSVTGLDQIDLWIGGLAEKQNLFGGLLGSTFNFIFETQLEALQDADRLYYLPRIEGIEFGSQVENSSFAELIMLNTGLHHLSASIFLTPEYTVEATNYFVRDAAGEFVLDLAGNRIATDSSTWLRNAVTGALLVEVLADGTVHFLGDDNFFGNTMVLGGTPGNDRLQAGQADDDTVWGDGGDDWLDGGNGNDFLYGGDGADTIRDSSGDDVIHGDAGNDDIDGGAGDDIIFGNDGDDLVHGGNSIFGDSVSGGAGNDVIFGDEGDDALMGNEGDDWISGGAGGDGIVGDIGAPTGQVPLYGGNDVLDGGGEGDKMTGFSGDDIMLGEGGFDKFIGKLGFDWASYENTTAGVSVDMDRREFIPNQILPQGDAVRDFFVETEAVSGSAFNDDLRGSTDIVIVDPVTGARIGGAGAVFNELTNVDLITGLAEFFPVGPVSFSTGNIMLGGDGSDRIEGRAGDDIIDGDAWLHVELTRNAQGNIFAGSQIIREIRYDLTEGDIDTAVYNDVLANYIVSAELDAAGNPTGFTIVSQIAVTPGLGLLNDGVDRIRNIERLQFADQTILLDIDNPLANQVPTGALTIDNAAPAVGDVLTVTSTLADSDPIAPASDLNGDGIVDGSLHYQWQYQTIAAGGTTAWVDIAGATGATFTVGAFELGSPIRVRATFVDGTGFTEHASSALTAAVTATAGVNTAPFINQQQNPPGLPDTSARTNTPINLVLPLAAVFADNQTATNNLLFSATLANGNPLASLGLVFSTALDANGVIYGLVSGTLANTGPVSIRVTATDTGPGAPLSVTDTFIINVLKGNSAPITAANQTFFGAEDVAFSGDLPDGVDPDGTTPVFRLVAGSAVNGVVTAFNQTTGAFTFVGAADFAGQATFQYTLFDGQSSSGQTTVTIDFAGENDGAAAFAITGTAAVGQTLIAAIGVDPDGEWDFAAATYEWFRGATSLGVTIGDPNYVVTAADVGQELRVVATYTDGQGFVENVSAGPIAPIGLLAVGALTGVNTATVTAFNSLVDPDGDLGPDAAFFTWEVSANVGGPFVDAPAAEVSADGLSLNQGNSVTRFVRATISYVDAAGNFNTATSEPVRVVTGNNNNNTLNGFAGVDIFFGLGGNDTINTGGGNDVLVGGANNDTLNGGAGDDTFLYTIGDGADTVVGGAGADLLAIRGTAGANTLDVTFNGTRLTGFEGGSINAAVEVITADLLGGNDTLDYGATTANVSIDLLAGTASGFTSIANIENAVGGSGGDTLVGSSGANTLSGGGGGDIINGGGGADALNGDGGADTLAGGAGNDTISGGGGTDTVVFSGPVANYSFALSGAVSVVVTDGSVGGPDGVDTVSGVETFQFGAQTLTLEAGTNGNNNGGGALNGGAGADLILGFNGNDALNGNNGADVLVGGNGADTMNGGAGNDAFVFSAGFGADTINGFDADAGGGGQDIIALSASLGVNAANFASHIVITDLGADTLITIDGVNTITLIGVNGTGANVITQADFIFGGP
jgi:Ca2+-binding RTX toxin-like protein